MNEIATTDPTPLKPAGPKSRITSLTKIYHQCQGQQPTSVDSSYSCGTMTEEQVYVRKKTLGDQWELLETGWLGNVFGLVMVVNDGKEGVIEIGFDSIEVVHLIIPSGQDFKGVPAAKVYLRGPAKAILYVFPK